MEVYFGSVSSFNLKLDFTLPSSIYVFFLFVLEVLEWLEQQCNHFDFLQTQADFSGLNADAFNLTYLGFGYRIPFLCYYIKHILILQSLDQNDNL